MTRGDTDVTRIASSHAQLCGVATAVVPMSQRRMLRPGWAGRFSRAGKGQRATPRPAPTGLTFNKARIPSCPRCPGRGSRGRHPPTPPPTAARGPGDAAASASPDDSAVGGGSGSSPPHRCPRSGGGQATDTLRRLFPARAGHDPRLRGRRRGPASSAQRGGAGQRSAHPWAPSALPPWSGACSASPPRGRTGLRSCPPQRLATLSFEEPKSNTLGSSWTPLFPAHLTAKSPVGPFSFAFKYTQSPAHLAVSTAPLCPGGAQQPPQGAPCFCSCPRLSPSPAARAAQAASRNHAGRPSRPGKTPAFPRPAELVPTQPLLLAPPLDSLVSSFPSLGLGSVVPSAENFPPDICTHIPLPPLVSAHTPPPQSSCP